jgi:hypothetical protein
MEPPPVDNWFLTREPRKFAMDECPRDGACTSLLRLREIHLEPVVASIPESIVSPGPRPSRSRLGIRSYSQGNSWLP